MAAYVIVDVEVTDPDRMGDYRKLAGPAVEAHGGRYLARGGETAVLEGDWDPRRLVVLEFTDLEAAKRWYDSEEYIAARESRRGAAVFRMVAVQGV